MAASSFAALRSRASRSTTAVGSRSPARIRFHRSHASIRPSRAAEGYPIPGAGAWARIGAMLENGRTVDRYVVEAPLGEGGMAQVYRVRHAALGTRHALKVLTLTRSDLRDRFLQEGRLQAGLRHPNVVSVTDVLEVDGQPA